MNPNIFSNAEFMKLKEDLNREIKRRGTFRWWDPLVAPTVGQDQRSPLTIPEDGEPTMLVSDDTYTINTPSEGAKERTRNICFPAHSDSPGGGSHHRNNSIPNTSAARFDVDEMRNYLIGLAKIQDINLFYGRDEEHYVAFRDPNNIKEAVDAAADSELNLPLQISGISSTKPDPLTGGNITYPLEGGMRVMPSGEFDGEETLTRRGPDETNFYDDHGAARVPVMLVPPGTIVDMERQDDHYCIIGTRTTGAHDFNNVAPANEVDRRVEMASLITDGVTVIPQGTLIRIRFQNGITVNRISINVNSTGPLSVIHNGLPFHAIRRSSSGQEIWISDSNFRPMNPFISPIVDRSHHDQNRNREPQITHREEGGIPSSRFGTNPRNPQQGNQYRSRPAFGGVVGSCNIACTGLCFMTCDNTCSESCTSTCWNRCGNACTATCGNICTGCQTMCYTGCKTKCENTQGFACLNAGALAVEITTRGAASGSSGEPGGPNWPSNSITYKTYSCNGCAYTCQFWPNKRTECWDAACQSSCFTSCQTGCAGSCYGGCIDNPGSYRDQPGAPLPYDQVHGRGCSSVCTANCVGTCHGVCEGECIQTCWHACKSSCRDNCHWKCFTQCGNGCAQGCTQGCTGCLGCTGFCESQDGARACLGCGREAGCVGTCQHNCNRNCLGWGCRSVCGIEPGSGGACSANCRINCVGASCTSLCSDACSSLCTTCANNCGFNCGPCFKAGTLIETENGPVPIEYVKVGDKVLTQSGEYHKVYRNLKRSCDDLIAVRAVGTPIIYTTMEHPFWVKRYIEYGTKNNKRQQLYSEPGWVEAKDINPRDKLCLYYPSIGNIEVDPGLAYMVGRWLGDGWVVSEKSHNGKYYDRFLICCGKHESEDFELKLLQSKISYTKHVEATASKYRIKSNSAKRYHECNNLELIRILKNCGKYSHGKEIANEIYKWDEISLSYLLRGYIDADGHTREDNNRFRVCTTSKKLAYGFSLIMRMLGMNPGWSIREYPTGTSIIQGRNVNVRTVYNLSSQFINKTTSCTSYDDEDMSAWSTMTLKEIPDHKYDVYNLSVEEDPTYYADGALVHNCTGQCSVGCSAECNVTCVEECENSCTNNCVNSCTDLCGGCSDLCYSCVGQCIGLCSVKCEDGCSLCANQCSAWCDIACDRTCFADCSTRCISSCSGSCATFLMSETNSVLAGPDRPPTSIGFIYSNPINRWQERESFKLWRSIPPTTPPYKIYIWIDGENNIRVTNTSGGQLDYLTKSCVIIGGVWSIHEDDGTIVIIDGSMAGMLDELYPNVDDNTSVFIIILRYNATDPIDPDSIGVSLPLGLQHHGPIERPNGDIIFTLQWEERTPDD